LRAARNCMKLRISTIERRGGSPWAKMQLASDADPGMSQFTLLPHKTPENVAGAIYGLILGSSIIAASSADHGHQPGVVEIYLCVTALVFFLAHVYARVIGGWIEGQTPTRGQVRQELRREWPMVSTQLAPALLLLTGVVGLLPSRTAIAAALGLALAELLVAVMYGCRQAHASRRQAALAAVVAVGFAVVVVLLKILVHS
jgi:hypothetical protein